MSLTLHFHPLSSYCHKALIALYENDAPFTPKVVNLQDEGARAAFRALWPVGKFPVLQDAARDRVVPESSIIIEYLDQHYPGKTKFIPADPDAARQMRLRDRYFDLHIHAHVQQIVGDRLRPADKKDPYGVAETRERLDRALAALEKQLPGKGSSERPWIMGEDFTMADCAAAPALFYCNWVAPLTPKYPNVAAYLERLKQRPSYARTLKEAEPYFKYFPKD
jgi:glutathione S-transferase